MKRVFMYNKAIVYIGELDQYKLAEVLNKVLSDLNIYTVRLTRQEEILVYNFDNNQILTINFNFYLIKDVLTAEDKLNITDKLSEELTSAIELELKRQKLIFTLD